MTFAELALEGREVLWTSNVVERAMGEISKRCKNQWMRWTEPGLESLLWLTLVRYADPEQFAAFADELLERSAKTASHWRCQLTLPEANSRRLCDGTNIIESVNRTPMVFNPFLSH